ncbi:unnamed protein product [Spirodela intermedia]|uniref:Uncharacterized protein n=1 Tax=Spirodela intermedia TaxID=51605 RepID=A0A7I8KE22_SPIIN|nr:unnamed protein product [Spirodela intermedia]
MGRPPCCDKSNVRRGLWTAEEDKKIVAYVSTHGAGNWASVPKKAGLKRCGKSCRLRWTNYLRPDLKHDDFTPGEEQTIISLHAKIGSRWSIIAHQLPGRTDNDVKNYWNTKLKKKLIQRGIDPVTHRPISHVVNSIQGLSRACDGDIEVNAAECHIQKDPRVSCLGRDHHHAFAPLPESTPDLAETAMAEQEAASYSCKPAWDLLVQLHAVKLVADASVEGLTTPLSFSHNLPGSAPLPSSLNLTPETIAEGPSDFSWTDLTPQGGLPTFPFAEAPPLRGIFQDEGGEICGGTPAILGEDDGDDHRGASSPSDINSFVESLLSRDDEMMWAFPEFLNDPFVCP